MADFGAGQERHKMSLERTVMPEIKELLKTNDGGMSQGKETAWKGHRPNVTELRTEVP